LRCYKTAQALVTATTETIDGSALPPFSKAFDALGVELEARTRLLDGRIEAAEEAIDVSF